MAIPVVAQPALISTVDGPTHGFIVPVPVPTPPQTPLHINNDGWNSFDVNQTDENGNIEIIPTSRTIICKDSDIGNLSDTLSVDEPLSC